jgi:replicative DNA helicase
VTRSGNAQPSRSAAQFSGCIDQGIVAHAAVNFGVPVAVFSPEMSAHDLTVRVLAQLSRVDAGHLIKGCSTALEWQSVRSTMPILARAPIYFDDHTTLTLAELRARARRLHVECGPLRLVVVDYVQLVHDPALRAENRNIELGVISRALRALAKELHVPIVVLSQLNRASETRQNGGSRPQLSDLRESGAIEQDADVVWLLHRPDGQTSVDLIIAKNRHGPTGIVKLRWIPEQMRFTDDVDNGREVQQTRRP